MNSNLMKRNRLIPVSVSIIFFILFLTWALMSANGIKQINWKVLFQNNTENVELITQLGGIRINTNQITNSDLKVTLNNQIQQLEDFIIRDIPPGQYTIILSATGYNDWTTSIEVIPAVITDISPLFSPSNPLVTSKLEEVNIDKIFFSTNGDYAYYVVTKASNGIDKGIFRLQLNPPSNLLTNAVPVPEKLLNLTEEVSQVINSHEYFIVPSPDNQKFILSGTNTPLYIFNTENQTTSPSKISLLSLERLLGFTPEHFDWFKGSSSVIISQDNFVGELILSNAKLVTIDFHPKQLPIFAINGDEVLLYDRLSNVHIRYRDETKTPVLLENTKLPADITTLYIDKINANNLIVQTKTSAFYLNLKASFIKEIGKNIEIISYTRDGNGVLFTKNGEKKLYSFTVDQNKINDDLDISISTIVDNYDRSTQKAFWSNSNTHVILVNQKVDSNLIEQSYAIYIIDRKGTNKYQLLNDRVIQTQGTDVYMLSDNSEVLLLIQDSQETATTSPLKRLYSIHLNIEKD